MSLLQILLLDSTTLRKIKMPKRRDLSHELIRAAMAKTKSVRACARYLNCSYQHLKKWMKIYEGENGKSLFEQHKNPSGKGIPKFLSNTPFGRKVPAVLDIISKIKDVSVGTSFTFTINNKGGVSKRIIHGNTGVVIINLISPNIDTDKCKEFLYVITNTTASSEQAVILDKHV